MRTLQTLQQMIDRFSEYCGQLLALLMALLALLVGAIVVLRYGFNYGSIALQESAGYIHGTVFMLACAYTLKHNAHVRVDIFYRRFSPRQQAWVDSIGCIVLLLPLCAFIAFSSHDFVWQSWQIREQSAEPGGLPALYLLKALIPAMAVLLGLQGIAELLRNTLFLCGIYHTANGSDEH